MNSLTSGNSASGNTAGGTQSIPFPAYQDGRTDQNAPIYDIEPFDAVLNMPKGWTVAAVEKDAEENFGLNYFKAEFYTPLGLYSEDRLVGVIGYNTFTPYEDEILAEQYYKTVYPTLRLGSMYIWEPYTPVKTTPDTQTAVVTVNYKDEAELAKNPGAAAAVPFTEVPGILSYDKRLKVYIGIQFALDTVTDEQVHAIAESIMLK